jgi:CheY-like chemotaxis protein/phosphoribosyl 1,2-cyclic phosphodiesterase
MAKPGPRTVRYGGNTSCVEVRAADGTLVVLDCGTGAHELGQALTAPGAPPSHGHLLISHTHWDHIQGFPFFAPLFSRGNEWDVYAPQGLGPRLEETLAGQMEYTYFPVRLEQLDATIRFHEVVEGRFGIGGVQVTARYLHHPALALGYRLEERGAVVVYATDHEPHTWDGDGGGAPAAGVVHREDQRHIEFLAGADLVVHDAQYTAAEYGAKLGWGHSPAERVVDYALAAGVRRLALFHHDPLRSDEALDALVEVCQRRAAAAGGALVVFAAAEGQVVDVAGPRAHGPAAGPGARAVAAVQAAPPGEARPRPAPASATILVVEDEPNIVLLLTRILEPEGFRVVSAKDGDTALDLARARRPDLILLDWKIPGRDGLSVCRALRAEEDPGLRDVPIVLMTARTRPEDTQEGFAAGATDYVAKPFAPAQIRTRVHTWLLRRGGTPTGGG